MFVLLLANKVFDLSLVLDIYESNNQVGCKFNYLNHILTQKSLLRAATLCENYLKIYIFENLKAYRFDLNYHRRHRIHIAPL